MAYTVFSFDRPLSRRSTKEYHDVHGVCVRQATVKKKYQKNESNVNPAKGELEEYVKIEGGTEGREWKD